MASSSICGSSISAAILRASVVLPAPEVPTTTIRIGRLRIFDRQTLAREPGLARGRCVCLYSAICRKGDGNAREQTDQAHSFCCTAEAAPARASPSERAVAATGACRRFDDRRGIGGGPTTSEGDGGAKRRCDRPYPLP